MNEALIVGALLLVLLGAVAFYLYSRILFNERKLGLIESLLLDIRMNMDMEDDRHAAHAQPFAAGPGPAAPNTVASSAVATEANEIVSGDDEYKAVMEEVQQTVVAEELPMPSTTVAAKDYDALSRDEVALLAEKRGIRVTKRMAKGTIIALLQEADKAEPLQGNSDVSGVPVASSAGGSPLDATPLEEVE